MLVTLTLATLTGCLGSFRLTRSVHAFNTQISDSPVVQELVFVAFLVVPVYELSLFADVLFLNVAERATGDSLIRTVPQSELAMLSDGRTLAVIDDPGGDGVWLEVSGQRARRIVRRGEALALLEGGVQVASVRAGEDGSLIVTRHTRESGDERRVVPPAVVQVAEAARGTEALARAVREAIAAP